MKPALIHFFEVEPWEAQILENHLPQGSFALHPEHVQDADFTQLEHCEILSCFIFSTLRKRELDRLPNLKLIATRSTGTDHIDLKTCNAKNICVKNVPLYGERTVAEHTFALILTLAKKIIPSVESARLPSLNHNALKGMDLYQKTLGIIGLGNIGRHVAEIALGFGMKVLVCDVRNDSLFLEKLELVSFEELLSRSDIITLHVPHNESTHHLIHQGLLPLIKRGALLINTSRGAVVETEALVRGLSEGIFGGLGLDVLEHEPEIREERELLSSLFRKDPAMNTLLANEYLLHHRHDNVVITPHNAFNTQEALERILQTTLQSIEAFKTGEKPHV